MDLGKCEIIGWIQPAVQLVISLSITEKDCAGDSGTCMDKIQVGLGLRRGVGQDCVKKLAGFNQMYKKAIWKINVYLLSVSFQILK